jgi:hypothetical protein
MSFGCQKPMANSTTRQQLSLLISTSRRRQRGSGLSRSLQAVQAADCSLLDMLT